MSDPLCTRRAFAASLALALPGAMAPASARAQALYPAKPLRLLVPFPAGDPPDILARALADRMGALLGQPVVIDNRPGAAGGIGAAEIARAPNDGHHLLYASSAMLTLAPLLRKTPYDPVKDFEPIACIASGQLAVTVNKAFPANSWPEFVAEARRHPRKYTVISSGDGSFLHLAATQMQSAAGIELVHVGYKALGQGVMDLVGGLVNVSLEVSSVLPHVRSGQLKTLLVLDERPAPDLPQVPTLRQHPMDYNVKPWFGVLAPAGTPAAVVQRLQSAMAQATAMPQYQERLPAGALPLFLAKPEFVAMMEADRAAYGSAIRRLNLKVE